MTYISDLQFYNPLYDGYDASTSRDLAKDDFLQLLVTQLKYQDPLEPMKDQEFVAQLAQFSQLEQLENMSESLDVSTQVDYLMGQTIANTMATTLIGKTVVAEGCDFTLTPGEDTNLGYHLGTDAANVDINIYNEGGALVRTVHLDDVSEGNNTFAWDGRDDNDSPLGPGLYSYEVSGTTTAGETVTTQKRVIGMVNSVKYIDGKAYLFVGGGFQVDISTIIEIEQSDNPMSNYEG
ncbi:MAG: flagellar hook assembly protein FlgD [candidate division Zixibacteria bacterium]|nr:flagellar hook assembly protein FlgD [candidate division Zixibacteria bacterium]